MRRIEGEQVLLRVILSESRTLDGQPLYRRILDLLRAEGIAGATVLTGIAGFGHDRRVHDVAVEVVAEGLPVVVEAVDAPERIDQILPRIEALMAGGVVMLERAWVRRYLEGPAGGP